MRRNPMVRVNSDLASLRKNQKQLLSDALNGLKVHEVDIDKIWANKLSNMNIVEEFFNGQKRKLR